MPWKIPKDKTELRRTQDRIKKNTYKEDPGSFKKQQGAEDWQKILIMGITQTIFLVFLVLLGCSLCHCIQSRFHRSAENVDFTYWYTGDQAGWQILNIFHRVILLILSSTGNMNSVLSLRSQEMMKLLWCLEPSGSFWKCLWSILARFAC